MLQRGDSCMKPHGGMLAHVYLVRSCGPCVSGQVLWLLLLPQLVQPLYLSAVAATVAAAGPTAVAVVADRHYTSDYTRMRRI